MKFDDEKISKSRNGQMSHKLLEMNEFMRRAFVEFLLASTMRMTFYLQITKLLFLFLLRLSATFFLPSYTICDGRKNRNGGDTNRCERYTYTKTLH